MKYKILKGLDLAGLQVFDPVVRLCYGEEPQAQLRKIGQFIVIPVITFLLFLMFWDFAGPRHTTKSGEVPTPGVVLDAADGVLTFHQRETIKGEDLLLSGAKREAALAEVESRLTEVEPLAAAAADHLKNTEVAAREHLTASTAALNAAYRAKRLEYRDTAKARQAELTTLAASVINGTDADRLRLLAAVDADKAATARETAEIQTLRDERSALENAKYPPLIAARAESNALAEELQFLRKRRDFLTTENREIKVTAATTKLAELETQLATAPDAATAVKAAAAIQQQHEIIATLETSTYSKPWTLPAQIDRSVRCVLVGFIVASVIAIPFGILCGLSRIFMAAMTPLISLFKPVSPIVWLPIIFVIVGGFIPDPSDSAVLRFLDHIPGLAGMDVNPAFIASALTVTMCSLWPTLVNTAFGVAAIDKDHINVARVLRLGFFARLFKIVIPSALPLMFAGLRISLGVGWMVLIAGELLSSSEGIGKFVWDMFNNGSSQTFAQMFVVVFVVGFIGLLFDRIMIILQRLVAFDGGTTAI
ncbi:ABC transporter permease [Synoicihabitans lomoniglobus]|uniref:ABC transporter permease subunit n=1 Tax=Synoicihabitans lomoniglobus TaxID=2909285 RepID=A0AAF0CRK6_9BACT|nr:ABC transporter permease subunit [Opitutaceae bacterium LMO-M01]WED66760.1 ABC transporter permease subunit [Opitutaceae bacterium LMO-M01]